MGGAVAALINQIVIMFILMAIGYALYRMKIIDRKGTSQMANVVIAYEPIWATRPVRHASSW